MGEVDAASSETGVFGRERRALTLGILLVVTAFAADGMGVVPALPTAVRALGGLPLFGWSFSAFMLAWLVGTIAAGQLADARGPHRPMALGLCAFGAGLLLAAGAGGMAQFIAGRVLQGLGGGAMMAMGYVAVARGYPDSLRARMMALISSVWILPAIVGPALSGLVAERISWRLVFAGIVPLLALASLLVLPPLRPFTLKQQVPDATQVRAALRLALGAGLVLGAPNLRGWGLSVGLLTGAVGLLLLIPALRALLPAGTLLFRAGLPANLAVRGLLAFSFFGTEAFIPLAAGALRGVSPTQAGFALTAGALGWIAASWLQDRLEARRGAGVRVGCIRVGFVLIAVGILGVAAGLIGRLPFLYVPLGWAMAGAGIGLSYSAGSLLCLAEAPPGQEGKVSGQLQLTDALGTAAGTGLGGAVLALFAQLGRTEYQAHAATFAIMLAAALLGISLAGRLSRGGEVSIPRIASEEPGC